MSCVCVVVRPSTAAFFLLAREGGNCDQNVCGIMIKMCV